MSSFIHSTYHRLLSDLSVKTYRYLYHKFDINQRLTGIIGPRGVGKTTLMLQYIKHQLREREDAFYFSADNILFNDVSLLSFVDELWHQDGIRIFFIDEIHKYPRWDQELKNLYDAFPKMKIIFSGSSSLDLIKGSHDLSRRATLYHLHGLSFREYLNMSTGSEYKDIAIDSLFNAPGKKTQVLSTIPKVFAAFKKYLQYGYYPFVFEEQHDYYQRLLRVVDKTIYEDIAGFYQLKTANLIYFKKILNFVASTPPGELNINSLAKNLSIDNKTTLHYLQILQDTGLVRLLSCFEGGNQGLRKPQKIFIHNPTLYYALNHFLGSDAEIGRVRECFFTTMCHNVDYPLFYSKVGDFQNDQHIFEIGGKQKTRQQVKGHEYALLVKDDILTASKGVLPLCSFGFIY